MCNTIYYFMNTCRFKYDFFTIWCYLQPTVLDKNMEFKGTLINYVHPILHSWNVEREIGAVNK
jgi:hypothetical protein